MNWEECRKETLLGNFLNGQKVKNVYWPDNKPVMFIEREDGKIVEFIPYSGYNSEGVKKTDPGFMLVFFDSKEHYVKQFQN
jgi:hypothetical protein